MSSDVSPPAPPPSRRERVLAAVRASLSSPPSADGAGGADGAAPDVPASLRGQLAAALDAESGAGAGAASAHGAAGGAGAASVGGLVLRSSAPGKPLRTSPALASALAGAELSSARGPGEVRAAALQLRERLLATGVYSRVEVGAEPRPDGRADVAVELDELTYSLSQGFSADVGGAGGLSASTDAMLLNLFGMGERFSASLKGSAADGLFAAAPVRAGGAGCVAAAECGPPRLNRPPLRQPSPLRAGPAAAGRAAVRRRGAARRRRRRRRRRADAHLAVADAGRAAADAAGLAHAVRSDVSHRH